MKFTFFATVCLTTVLVGCGSKFENSYTEGCVKEGKYSKDRCKCVAGILDKKLDADQKQLMLNPGDISLSNFSKAFELVKPSMEALEICREKGT